MAKMYAMVSSQGTACYETAICGNCNTAQNRARIEAQAKEHEPESDRPIAWADCSGNDALQCTDCGKRAHYTRPCDNCGHELSQYKYAKGQGLCAACIEAIN
jgi:hypothetical protein